MNQPLVRAIGLFAIGCGALFLAFESCADTEPDDVAVLSGVDVDTPATALGQALVGLEVAQRARQALTRENYGLAAAEVRSLERLLTDMVAELAEPAAD